MYAYSQVTNAFLPTDKTILETSVVNSSKWNYKQTTTNQFQPVTIPQPSNYNSKPFAKPNIQLGKTNPNFQLWKIQSAREPYAYQYMVNGYGGVNTRLGTSLGSL